MRTTLTVSVTKLSSLFQLVEEKGLKTSALLEKAGIDPAIPDCPDNRLPLADVYGLTHLGASLTGDPDFGLHQGERFMGFSNILGYVMMNCQTLEAALAKFSRYQKICDESTVIELVHIGGEAFVTIRIMDDTLQNDRHLVDSRLAGLFVFLKRLTGVSLRPRKLMVTYAAPPVIDAYKRIFKCPVYFNRPVNALVFESRDMKLSIPSCNIALLETFERHARRVVERLEHMDSHSNQVARIIAGLLKENSLSIKSVAEKMAMSVRKLQFKLEEEKTTYSKILNEIRKDLAMSYLKDNRIAIAEIAYLLGYSEVSVFYRAFKKWTDQTPAQYRQNTSQAQRASDMVL